MIRGSVDVVTTQRVSGWIYSDDHEAPLSVEVVINDALVGKGTVRYDFNPMFALRGTISTGAVSGTPADSSTGGRLRSTSITVRA